jgi:putative ABC transport system substrate-binding protein
MRRRDLLSSLLATLVASPARAAGSGKIFRIAVASQQAPVAERNFFFGELRRLGYVEGENLVVLHFSAEGDTARFDSMVRDVVSASPDVIFTANNPLVLRFKALAQSTPFVALMGDPVAFGIVRSLAHPAGNITGISADAGVEIWSKRLGLLVEAVPTATRVAYLSSELFWDGPPGDTVREAARRSSVTMVAEPLRGVYQEAEYLRVFDVLQREHVQALLVSDSAENLAQRNLIVKFAEQARLPALYSYREFVSVGGLMAYAVDLEDEFRRAALYVDMILKGTKAGEIPIFQEDRFATVINLKTAKALGITIPPSLLGRADEVIE